jgi:flagellar biogenesis protein FliO
MTLAARGSTWGGMVIGLIAAAIFVLFSAWVVAERIRGHRKDGRPDD